MIICPECGEENPQESKFCRKCGVNLVHENKTTKNKEPPKKATVINNTENQHKTVNSATSTRNKDDDKWVCLGCCVCIFFIFLIFAIAGI